MSFWKEYRPHLGFSGPSAPYPHSAVPSSLETLDRTCCNFRVFSFLISIGLFMEQLEGENLTMEDNEHKHLYDRNNKDVSYDTPGTTEAADKSLPSLDSRDVNSSSHEISGVEAETDASASGAVGQGKSAADHHAQGDTRSFENGTSLDKTSCGMEAPLSGKSGTDPIGASPMVQQFEEAHALSPEEERLWAIVKANSLDFTAWTVLIQEVEKVSEDNISKVQRVYDAFLAEFPLCYGYWKKYADHEARLGNIDKIVEVYERAVVAVTYSVDIWLHYCTFAVSTYDDPHTVCSNNRAVTWQKGRLFERGLAYVGTDYLAYPLWDKYIEYEYSRRAWMNLAIIYTRILEYPIQQLDHYFNSFKELVAHHPLSEIRSAEEVALLTANLRTRDGVDDRERSGEAEQFGKPSSTGLTEAEELEKYISIREEMYRKAKDYDAKIHDFEAAIRRPYFHVKPLDDHQLNNWHKYLDFIETEGDLNKIVKLYERCVIACAIYPEFWIRYVLCMEANGSMELSNNALSRASQVFVKRQPEIHLFAARFKEHNGDIAGARAEYHIIHSEIAPGLLEAVVKHANMEHRLGHQDAAFAVYEEAIATERGNEHSQILPLLLVQYSKFLYLVSGNVEKAREVLSGSLEQLSLSKPILEGIIHLESIQPIPKRIDYLDSLVERFLVTHIENTNSISAADREDLSSIFLEFLDFFGDAQAIKKAENRHVKLFSQQKSTSESRKRRAEEFLSSDKTKSVRTCADASASISPVQSVMGAYPSVPQQWAAGYGSQPQGWPQGPQTLSQQWNPGATQTGYAGYTGYSYPHPQPLASAPQQAAYGAYAQAYPTQAYAQPVPTLPLAQQSASVPQAYYGRPY